MNPFLEDPIITNDRADFNDGSSSNDLRFTERPSPEGAAKLTYEDIANQLLADGFLLSALELHTELQELGRPVASLRDYFSNPGNFERAKLPELHSQSPPVGLQRSGSIQTFDSLEWDRYTDDGTGDRIAGLEFELRKAHDQIKSLRKALTKATEKEICVEPDQTDPSNPQSEDEVIKPHVKRAINFLLNEYLLLHDYKLTSVTFAEENENQDFENWDDVGLNIAKPPDLLHLYLDFGKHSAPEVSTFATETQVDLTSELIQTQTQHISTLKAELEESNSQYKNLTDELGKVNKLLENSQTDKVDLQQRLQALSDDMEKTILQRQSILYSNESTHKYTYQHTDREIPQSFLDNLLQKTYSISTDNRIAYQVSLIDKTEVNTILDMMSQSLPYIIPNVLLQKREELLPLILCVANLHPSDKSRDRMLSSLFNLIKKPDSEQRQMILAGCLMFAQHNGPERLETELLPQIWEQINDKYPERRLLVAEACTTLIPYISNAMRSSLVLSMLNQMLVEEKDESVRAAVIKSLGVLISFIDDEDKFEQMLQLYRSEMLKDDSSQIEVETTTIFLPSLCLWASHLRKLSAVMEVIFSALQNSMSEPNEYGELSVHTQKFLQSLQHLDVLSNYLFISMITSGPYTEHLHESEPSEGSLLISDDIYLLTSDKQTFTNHLSQFINYTSEEWYEVWPEYELLIFSFFSKLTMVLLTIQEDKHIVLNRVNEHVIKICKLTGQHLTNDKIRVKFEEFFDLNNIKPQHNKIYTSMLLPVYLCGVCGAFITHNDDILSLCSLIQTYIETLSQFKVPVTAVRQSIHWLCSSESSTHEPILDMLWELLTDENITVRSNLVQMFQVYCHVIPESNLLNSKVLPALINLVRDRSIEVQASAVPALGELLLLSRNPQVSEKVVMEINSLIENQETTAHTELQISVINMFNKIGPNSEPNFRDEVILPTLYHWCQSNNRCGDTIKRRDIALSMLKVYSALSCCFMSSNALSEVMLPGLRCLSTDLRELVLDGLQVIQSMIKDYENRLNPTVSTSQVHQPAVTTPDHKTKKYFEKPAMSKMTNLFSKKK